MKGIQHLGELKKKSIESVFSKIVEESNSSERMNLANSFGIESPKLVHFRHPPIETNNVGNLRMRHLIVPARAPPDPVRVLYAGSDDTIEQVP